MEQPLESLDVTMLGAHDLPPELERAAQETFAPALAEFRYES